MSAILPKSSLLATGLSLSSIRPSGEIRIASFPAGTLTNDDTRSLDTLSWIPGARIVCVKNLETDYVLSGIAKMLTGELPTIDIRPTSMAVGSGTAPVTTGDTGLSSELIRKPLTGTGATVTRAGSKAIFRITLFEGEVLGQIGCLGLFNGDSGGSGHTAAGSLQIGGTPLNTAVITVSVGGRSVPSYWVTSTNTAQIAAGLAAWLNGDGYFSSLFTCTAAGTTISVASKGSGTAYNQSLVAQVSGGVTCATTNIAGGTTPGGQLLAAANCNFTKEPATQVLIEWSINITN